MLLGELKSLAQRRRASVSNFRHTFDVCSLFDGTIKSSESMGRITVFTAEGCSASIRTMALLEKRKLPFIVINVTDHSSKRLDLLKLCHRYSTPQVFFNTRHIGGCKETIALLNEWALSCEGASENGSVSGSSTVSFNSLGTSAAGSRSSKKEKTSKNKSTPILYASIHDRYMVEIGNHHDPSDPRLSVPLKVPDKDVDTFARDESMQYFIKLPSGDRSSILEMTVMLIDIIRHVDNTVGSISYKHTFTGRDLLKAIQGVFEISSDDALTFSGKLLSIGIFSVMGNVLHENKEAQVHSQAVYRLKCLEKPCLLNSFCDWNENIDLNYMRLINRLTNIFNSIQMGATDRYGTLRRERAIKHHDFHMFEEAICELQGVHLSQMNDSTKIAFGINLYNLMMQYAIIKIGAPDQKVKNSRLEFFSEIKFNIGGYLYSLYEWEHGILRGNVKGPSCDGMSSSSVPFGRKDPRIAYCVANPDARIHFAINHGTNSCPSIRRYSAENIDEELKFALKSFCETESNARFDEGKLELHVSKIFTWYRSDFVDDAKILPQWIFSYTHGPLQQRLDIAFANKGKSVKVVEAPFDWSMKSGWVYGALSFEVENFKMSRGRNPLSCMIGKSSVRAA